MCGSEREARASGDGRGGGVPKALMDLVLGEWRGERGTSRDSAGFCFRSDDVDGGSSGTHAHARGVTLCCRLCACGAHRGRRLPQPSQRSRSVTDQSACLRSCTVARDPSNRLNEGFADSIFTRVRRKDEGWSRAKRDSCRLEQRIGGS